MSILYRVMGGGVIFCAATVYGIQANGKVLKQYNITEYEQSFMKNCQSTMSRHNLSFAEGANKSKGCACMTKTLLSAVESEEVPAIQAYISFTMQIRAQTEGMNVDFAALQNDLEQISKDHEITELKALEYVGLVGESVVTCGNRDNHSPEKIAEYAAMTPKGVEIQVAQISEPENTQSSSSSQKSTITTPNTPKLRGLSNG